MCREIISDFYVKAYFHEKNGWIITVRTESIWFWALIIYDVVYIGACILICYSLQKTAVLHRERKQARVLFISSAASLLTGLVITFLISVQKFNIPDITPMSGAIWSIGIYYTIVRYKLMAMTPSYIAENLFQTIIDSVILTNPEGLIVSVNPETQMLLGYTQKELVGEPLESLFLSDNEIRSTNIHELLNTYPIRGIETFITSKNGVQIPIILSISECKDNFDTRIGFVLASKD